MKLTVLVDNNTYINKYYFGEPALSFYIENKDDKILFDLGYSDIFVRNANLMKINIDKVNKIIFSHGHNDHTGGLKHFKKRVDIIAHEDTFKIKRTANEEYGSFINEEEIKLKYNFIPTNEPKEVSNNLYYLGEIPELNNFEKREKMGLTLINNVEEDDYTLDDSALVYKNEKGLHIITGCSHSGICNIIEYAKTVLNENKVVTVIGGFHLFNCGKQLEKTIQYFEENSIKNIYPCHCTSFNVKAKLNENIEVNEVGVGMTLDFD